MTTRIPAIVLAALAAAAAPASAQSLPAGTAAEGLTLPLALPPGAETGKPRFYAPAPPAPPPAGCAGAVGCRVRVLGAIQHDGAVELNAAVLKW